MKNLPAKRLDVVQSTAIRRGSLSSLLPAFQRLAECIEHNPWHDHQSVFDHTVAALAAYESIVPSLRFLKPAEQRAMREYLREPVYGIPRGDLIRVAIVFHDIAKPDVWMLHESTGTTSCPAHEMRGIFYVQQYGEAFGLTTGATRIVSQMVLLHGIAHEATNAALSGPAETVYPHFEKTVGDLYAGLLFLSHADANGSSLPKLHPEHWDARKSRIEEALIRFSASK